MQPDDFKYLLKRLSCTRERLSEYLYDRIAPCRVEFAPESKPRFWPPPETGWQTVSPGYAWGDAWQYGWFRLTCDWTKEHSGTEPVLDLRMGGEGLVYTENGTPLTAISLYSTYAPTSEKHFVRLGHPAPEGPMTFYVRCAAHFFNGLLIAPGEVPHRTPMNYTEYKAVFAHADIGRINATLQRYLFLLHHFEGLLKSTNANPETPSFIARKWATAVRDSLNLYAEDFRNLPAALNLLEESVLHPAEGWRPTAHAVGHAHLDIAWLWPVSEGVQKAARTFSEQLTNIERQPGYIFGASQAYLYEQLKEFAPGVFRRIKEAVRDGRWEIQGGMYVEADSNCTGGESLVRQFLYGKAFFRKEFGVDVQTVWLPDSFGFSAVLPQIASQAGCFAMVTAKPFWASVQNKEFCQKFPYSAFRWRGLRGELLVNILPMCYYNGTLTPDMLNFAADTFTENDVLGDFLVSFGIGDGGGGPTEEMIERGRLTADECGVTKVRFSTAFECLAKQRRHLDMLPTWDGEIYLELHRGTLSNIARMKRLNRMAERRLENLEFLNVSLGGGLEPGVLEMLWKRLLLNQFHDILPGSAIPSVYQRTFRELEELIQKANAEVLSMVSKATLPEEDSLLLFNPTSHPHHELIWGDDGRCSEVTLPPFSSQVIHPSELVPLRSSLPPRDGLYTLENPLVRYQFDSNALLVSAMHKATGTELIPRNRPANLLACHVDRPNQYDAWEVEREYMNMPQARPETKIISLSATLFCQVLEVEHRWENSTARQRILLAGNSARLDFVTEVDWHENHRMLRVEFPLTLHFDQVRCDLGFGFIRRSALDNLTSERNQFEFSCQKYIACGEDKDCVGLLNDCKYGASARNGALGLTLLRSARYPDELTDRGHHSFTYSFLAFSDEATLLQEAVALNAPLLQFPGRTGTITSPVKELAIPGVALEALKFAEDGSGDFIVRLVEQLGEHTSGTLRFSFPVDISSVNLLEEPGSEIAPCKGTSVQLAFQPFEIISLRCRPIHPGPA